MSLSDTARWKDLLRQARVERNWRQRDVAERLGASVLTIQRWERGSHQPSVYFQLKLCALFGKSAEELGFVLSNSPPSDDAPDLEGELPVEGENRLPAFPAFWNVPYPRNRFFTGREEFLHHLHEQFNRESATALTQSWAISG